MKKLEPIYSTYFDVEFTSVDLTEDDKQSLRDCVKGVVGKDITFGLYYDEESKKIIPIEALLKLKESDKKSDVIISILNKVVPASVNVPIEGSPDVPNNSKILGTLIYKECNMSVDLSGLLSFQKPPKNDFGIFFHGTEKEVTLSLHSNTILYNNKEI